MSRPRQYGPTLFLTGVGLLICSLSACKEFASPAAQKVAGEHDARRQHSAPNAPARRQRPGLAGARFKRRARRKTRGARASAQHAPTGKIAADFAAPPRATTPTPSPQTSNTAAPPPAARNPAPQSPKPADTAAASKTPPLRPSPEPTKQLQEKAKGKKTTKRDLKQQGWGASIYLSNDDSMSLSSAQRIEHAIRQGYSIPIQHIRPHELLNYYRFARVEVPNKQTFQVLAALAPKPNKRNWVTLGLLVQGRRVSRRQRRVANITLILDVSCSMRSEGRMRYLKRGLRRMVSELKTGDIVNVVTFSHRARVVLKGHQVTSNSPTTLNNLIRTLQPDGGTNLYAGLQTGYRVALQTQKPEYNARVIMITDAQTNTGVVDPRLIALSAKHFEKKGVRLSGIGVGSDFNDVLLDRLTEKSKGAYVYLGSRHAVERIFGEGFNSLLSTIAENVRFRLHLPDRLRMKVFYGEEASTSKAEVQPIHYHAGTSQLFLQDLEIRNGTLPKQQRIKFDIEYQDPTTQKPKKAHFSFRVGDIMERNVKIIHKARAVMAYVKVLEQGAKRQFNTACKQSYNTFKTHRKHTPNDNELAHIHNLLQLYCKRHR